MRQLQQDTLCADLVPGGSETSVDVAAGSSATVASWQDAGPIYVAAAAEDATSPEGPSQYSLELLHGSSSPQPVTAVAGCATTPVADGCQADGPAPASIQLRCLNGDRPCRVRVSSYVSPCPGGPQPLALAAGEHAGTRPPPAQPGGLPAPPPPFPGGSSGGVSTTTWVIVGASAGAALLLVVAIWCLIRRCTRRRRQRPGTDLEAGLPPLKPAQQQFIVGGGAALPPYRPPYQQQQPAWRAQPQQLAPHAVPAAPGEAARWAFGYKLAGGSRGTRRTFATHAGRQEGPLQEWPSIDDWLHSAVAAQQQWEGCLLYSDQPPAGCPQPEPYQTCAHAKGVVLWSSCAVGWLVHSVPRWPQPLAPGQLVLPPLEAPQLKLSQSFLFVTLPRAQLPTVFGQLQHMQVLVYDASDARLWPWAPWDYTKAVGQGLSVRDLGPGLWHIGKANEPHSDLYDSLARRFGGVWLVRTNLRTVQSEEAKCPSSAAVKNVSQWLPPGCEDRAPYKAGSEHAKLGVCVSQPLVLVGDMNNVRTQHKRGGGGLVLRHKHLAELLKAAAVAVDMP